MEKNKLAIPEFLSGGGEMGELIRSFDWSKTPLGEPEYWQQSLKTCVRILLTSPQPMFVWWGKNYINIYNDAYKFILGEKHPKALGRPGNETWKEIWNEVGARADIVFNKNEGTFDDGLLLIMNRYGYDEETYFKFSYNPIPGDNGGTAGLFCACTEETERIVSERQLNTLQELSRDLAGKKSVDEVFKASMNVLKKKGKDFPFSVIYSCNDDGQLQVAACSSENLLGFYPTKIDTEELRKRHYDLIKVISTKKWLIVEDLKERFGDLPSGQWNLSPSTGLLLPIIQSNHESPFAVLKIGINPYKQLDEKYFQFFQLVADQISTALSNVRALEEERKRIQALEEIDRAKTVFFTNISHEFRTPLTLMLGPLEELMNASATNFSWREISSIETTHRNALRLLKLVNTLLDFSRIESGRHQANFSLTDISSLTKNLAANFRSIIERAGLRFEVNTEVIIQPVYVDKQMWEKIVFNLLSNAFKFTLEGKIAVSIRPEKDHVVFSVTDTGIGIPEKDMPKLFERFHRINNSTGRSFEGTGIGLSLTKELIHLQGGKISVSSKEGHGTEFTVTIPFGKEHIDASRIVHHDEDDEKSLLNVYVDEAISFLDSSRRKAESIVVSDASPSVLIVDDNADMREHLASILERHYRVIIASNGLNALHRLREEKPDVILSDIMMPIMDGLQFLKQVKQDPQTARIPFILLTARAGEESKLEGYDTGADDYLVKPFSAVELLARIKAQLQISKKWHETEERLRGLLMQAPAAIAVMEGPDHVYTLTNSRFHQMFWRSPEQLIGKTVREAFPEINKETYELLDNLYKSGETFVGHDWSTPVADETGVPRDCFYDFVIHPIKNEDGKVTDLMVHVVETTDSVLARKKIEDNAAMIRDMYMNTPAFIAVFKGPEHVYELVNPHYQSIIGDRNVVGKRLLDALPELKDQGIDASFDHVYKTGETVIDKERLVMLSRGPNKEPEVAYFDYSFQPIYNESREIVGILAFGLDITAQVNARKKIEESESNLKKLANSMPQFVWIANETGEIVYCNDQLDQYAGSLQVSDSMWNLEGMLHDLDRQLSLDSWNKSINNKSVYEIEHRMKMKDGSYRWHLCRAYPQKNEEGVVTQWYGTSTDIHDQKAFAEKLEKEVAARTADLQRINKELESFNYITSHDLQEPLRKIQTFVELIRRSDDETTNASYLERIRSSAHRMSELIKSLLTYSNLSNTNFSSEKTDLNTVVKEVISDLELSISDKKARIKLDQLPVINAIPMQMYQLFLNIFSNSLKFTTKAPVIKVTTELIDKQTAKNNLLTTDEKDYWKISIADNGIGIEEKFNEQVFKLFQRLHLKNEYPGTGVGLSIVKRIVENHNGLIRLDSIPKKGTTISIYLPA